MPVHCCHFRYECFHVPRGENDDIPPHSNDNIWNPGRGGKQGKRLSGWQPLSVSCCHRERANARTSDASLHATLRLTAASAAQEPGRSQEGNVMGNAVFEVSCHVKDLNKVGDDMPCLSMQYVVETHEHWDKE